MKRVLIVALMLAVAIMIAPPQARTHNETVLVTNCKYSAIAFENRHYQRELRSTRQKLGDAEANLLASQRFIVGMCSDPELPVALRNTCTDWQNERTP
jgi:hypothetical protein